MSKLAPPPVPRKLCELLQDHPDQIARLQEALDQSSDRPSPRIQPFDEAVWALENRLDALLIAAQDDLASAEASGDPVMIGKAREREALISRARPKFLWISDEGLWNYFQENKEAFE